MSIFSKLFSSPANMPADTELAVPVGKTPAQPAVQGVPFRYERGGHIVVFLVDSDGDALVHLTLDLIEPFRKHCRDILFVDMQTENPLQQLMSGSVQGVWFALSFFGLGQGIVLADADKSVNLWVAAGVPFVRVFGDSPAYFPDSHFMALPNSINFYGHPEHLHFYRRWFDSKGFSVQMVPILLDRLAERPTDLSRKIAGKNIVFPKMEAARKNSSLTGARAFRLPSAKRWSRSVKNSAPAASLTNLSILPTNCCTTLPVSAST